MVLFEITATSSSCKKINSFASFPIARGSDAAKFSFLPFPTSSGDLHLAT